MLLVTLLGMASMVLDVMVMPSSQIDGRLTIHYVLIQSNEAKLVVDEA